MNAKILVSLATMLVVGAAATAGTVAYYTSSASMTGATFTSASMNLFIDDNPAGATQHWVSTFVAPSAMMTALGMDKVYPGKSGEQIFDIKNSGDVDGKVSLKFQKTAWSVLGDNLVFTVYYDEDNDNFADSPADTTAIASGTVGQFLNNTYLLGDIAASHGISDDGIASVKIKWNVPMGAGNDIMGKSITLNTIFDLEQIH